MRRNMDEKPNAKTPAIVALLALLAYKIATSVGAVATWVETGRVIKQAAI